MKKRVFAVLLSLSLLMTGSGSLYAAELSPEAPMVIEGTLAAESVEASEAAAVPENTAQTEAPLEGATASSVRQITGFVPLEKSEQSLTVSAQGKPSLSELISRMPKAISVYYNGSQAAEALPVTWEAVGEDYTLSDSFYFQFSPKWDEDVVLAEGLNLYQDAPYISVFLTNDPVTTKNSVTISSQALGASISSAEKSSNQLQIYRYLTSVMGFNCAAACGVLANIQAESSFNHTATGDNGTSYGICQWHNTRWTDLKNYCAGKGLDWTTLDGQLNFLNYELNKSYPTILRGMKSRGNTASDAYLCGAYWCETFERPKNAATVGVTRGNLAMNTYFPKYSNGDNDGAYISPGGTDQTVSPEADTPEPTTPTTGSGTTVPTTGSGTTEPTTGSGTTTPTTGSGTTTPAEEQGAALPEEEDPSETEEGTVYHATLVVNQKMDLSSILCDRSYVSYTVTPSAYASVNAKGILTARRVSGETEVKVTGRVLQKGKWVNSASYIDLDIVKPSFTTKKLELVSTDTDNAVRYLESAVAPDSWISSNPKVAEVGSDGLIKPVSAGTARITAQFGENINEAAKYSFTLRVLVPSLNRKKVTMLSGTDVPLTLRVSSRALTPSWSSSDARIAAVDSSGRVKALSAGTVTITATYNGQPFTSVITVKKPTLSVKRTTLRAGSRRKIKLNNTKLSSVEWTSDAPEVAYVDDTGYLVAVSPGSAVISTGTGGCTDQCFITVK